jgi:hypothetical protein
MKTVGVGRLGVEDVLVVPPAGRLVDRLRYRCLYTPQQIAGIGERAVGLWVRALRTPGCERRGAGQRNRRHHNRPPNGIVGVVGPNGVGKATLLKMITGEEWPDAGTLRVGETVRISYTERDGIDPENTVWEAISGGELYLRAGRQRSPAGSTRRRSGSRQRTGKSPPG